MTASTSLTIPARFNGPPRSGNGGWSAGALAKIAGHATTTVQLRQPPPLETPMPVETLDGWTTATHADAPALRARACDDVLVPVAPVAADVARAAQASYAGLRSHPFPGCFVCGTDRADGLRIFPGRVGDDRGAARLAATWTPTDRDPALTWAALDCIGGWSGDLAERLMVLGTMTARVDALPEPGVEHVVVGGDRGTEGRKTYSAATLYSPDGSAIATAEHVWIAVDPKAFSRE